MQKLSVMADWNELLIGDYEFESADEIDLVQLIADAETAVTSARTVSEDIFREFFVPNAQAKGIGVFIGLDKTNSVLLDFSGKPTNFRIVIKDSMYGYDNAKRCGMSFAHMKMIERYIKSSGDKIVEAVFLKESTSIQIKFLSHHTLIINYIEEIMSNEFQK